MRAKSSARGAFATLFPYVKSHRVRLLLVFALVVAVVVIDLIQPWLVKEVIDRYVTVSRPDAGAIARMAAAYMGLVLLAFGLTYYQDIVLQRVGLSIVRSIRIDLFKHIQRLALRYFDQNSAGRIMTNVVSDTEALNNFFTQFLANTLRGVFTLLLIMFSCSVWMSRSRSTVFCWFRLLLYLQSFFREKSGMSTPRSGIVWVC
jgi:ATP-binding cassette subfamily B multidrug efflux pump